MAKEFPADMMSETLAETALLQQRHAHAEPAPRARPLRLRVVGLLAGAVALVLAGAGPSLADRDSDTLAKIIVGGLIVGAIVNDMQQRDDDALRWDEDEDEDFGRAHSRRTHVPGACAITIDSRDSGRVTLYGGNCLRDYGFRNLPRCGRSVTIYGERDRLYSADCLRRAGLRTNQRRDDR